MTFVAPRVGSIVVVVVADTVGTVVVVVVVDVAADTVVAAAAHRGLEYSRVPVAAVARPGGRSRAAGRPAKGIAVAGNWGAGIAVSDAQAMKLGI